MNGNGDLLPLRAVSTKNLKTRKRISTVSDSLVNPQPSSARENKSVPSATAPHAKHLTAHGPAFAARQLVCLQFGMYSWGIGFEPVLGDQLTEPLPAAKLHRLALGRCRSPRRNALPVPFGGYDLNETDWK